LDGLLDFLRTEYKAEKFYFFGGSMGGTANLTYACLRPQNVAGVVANGAATDLVSYISFCRNGQDKIPVLKDIADAIEKNYNHDTALMRAHSALYNWQALKGKRILYTQGTFDQLMPVADARRFAGVMAEERGFAYVEIPGGDHDSPLFIGFMENSSIFKPFDWMEGAASQS
ncbi:MAG: alpha/beta hydrolase, partial [Victivallales bacterium]|nr:alpha/beta hydrolase [Victivallales bacterium]